jgi:peptidoglycan-N-acetylglucosamine deacetylase
MPRSKKVLFFSFLILSNLAFSSPEALATEVALTIDDPIVSETPLLSPHERNEKILAALDKNGLKAALFVCGQRVDNEAGMKLLKSWDDNGHLIGSHSYSHLYYHSKKLTYEAFRDDFIKNEPLIKNLSHFEKFFRFPFLKEGDSKDKRDKMRSFLKERGYRNGYVTIDASDWYIDERLKKKLSENPKANISPYRDFYLKHIWERANFYNDLAKKIVGKEVKHTLLIHHTLLNALFLDDLIQMFKSRGWKLIDAQNAYQEIPLMKNPDAIPAGESILWSLAKQTGKFDEILRYPAEDAGYERKAIDKLGL